MTIVIENLKDKTTSKRDKKNMRKKYKHDILVAYHSSINIDRSEKKIRDNREESHLSSDNSTFFISFRIGSRCKEIGWKYRKWRSNKSNDRKGKRVHTIGCARSGLVSKVSRDIKNISKNKHNEKNENTSNNSSDETSKSIDSYILKGNFTRTKRVWHKGKVKGIRL